MFNVSFFSAISNSMKYLKKASRLYCTKKAEVYFKFNLLL